MLTIPIAGVIAELIVLPALLAGPLGRAFEKKKIQSDELVPSVKELEPIADSKISGLAERVDQQ